MSDGRLEHVVASVIANTVALSIGLFVTRRSSRRFLWDWRQAREGAREQIRMRQELEYAREIQMSMLPRETPSLDWLDLATVSIPATEVGGDYYDFFFPSEERVVLVSADVAGHGLGSGLVLSGVRSGLALLSDDLDRPEQVMERLHGMLLKTTGTRMLVTMAMLSLDRLTFRARYATAGHPPMLLRRNATGLVEEVFRGSLPLGSALGGGFAVDELEFTSGDVFILHTDGVYEMRDQAGDSYGMERLAASVQALSPEANAREVRNAILRDVTAFRGAAPQEDDLTLVVARVI
jgi:serine phosphatase RsbU (regulator of sigma subunit)